MNSHAIVYVPTKVGEGFFTDFQPPASGATDEAQHHIQQNLLLAQRTLYRITTQASLLVLLIRAQVLHWLQKFIIKEKGEKWNSNSRQTQPTTKPI